MAIIMMKRLPICSYGTRTNEVKFKNKVDPADLLRRVDFSSSKIGVTRFDEKDFVCRKKGQRNDETDKNSF